MNSKISHAPKYISTIYFFLSSFDIGYDQQNASLNKPKMDTQSTKNSRRSIKRVTYPVSRPNLISSGVCLLYRCHQLVLKRFMERIISYYKELLAKSATRIEGSLDMNNLGRLFLAFLLAVAFVCILIFGLVGGR